MKILKLMVWIIKFFLIWALIKYALPLYHNNAELHKQNILFFILIFIPLFTGYERLIAIVIKAFEQKES